MSYSAYSAPKCHWLGAFRVVRLSLCHDGWHGAIGPPTIGLGVNGTADHSMVDSYRTWYQCAKWCQCVCWDFKPIEALNQLEQREMWPSDRGPPIERANLEQIARKYWLAAVAHWECAIEPNHIDSLPREGIIFSFVFQLFRYWIKVLSSGYTNKDIPQRM